MQCDKLVKAGIIRTRVRGGALCYYYPIWVPGIREGILSNREQCDAHPELGACFEEYTRIRVGMLAPVLGNGVNFMRVMPVMSAIENDTHKATYDELSTLIEKAWAISVGPCSCRRSRRLMGEGCGHLEEDMCLYLNDNAVSFSKSGEHRLITKEEAYEILRRAEDNGLVHEVNQASGFDDVTAICNCCGCSCYALRIAEMFRSPNGVSSNFIARVDKDKCAACGQCVENCQTNAVRLGAEVTVIYRRDRDSMPAADNEIAEAAEEGVSFRFLASPVEILGDGRVEALKVETMELRNGKPAGTDVYETMNVSAVISAVGQEIDLNGISVDTGAKGTVTVSLPSFQTSEAGVFAGGDAVTGPKFAIDAIAAGKEGAVSIHRYVHPGQSQVIGRDHRDYKPMNPATAAVALDGFDTAPRQKVSGGSAKDAEKTFRDLRGTLTEEQMKIETRRCLDCGTAVVDESLCVGCGICTTKCKFDAIRLEKVTDYVGAPYFKALLGAAGNAPAALAKLVVKKVARP